MPRRRSEMLIRGVLLGSLLLGPAAFAQGTGNQCLDSCGKTMTSCAGPCKGDANCANGCMKRYSDCSARCTKNGKVDAMKPNMAKQKSCMGPNGKPVKCNEYEAKNPRPEAEPREEYPNKAA